MFFDYLVESVRALQYEIMSIACFLLSQIHWSVVADTANGQFTFVDLNTEHYYTLPRSQWIAYVTVLHEVFAESLYTVTVSV